MIQITPFGGAEIPKRDEARVKCMDFSLQPAIDPGSVKYLNAVDACPSTEEGFRSEISRRNQCAKEEKLAYQE